MKEINQIKEKINPLELEVLNGLSQKQKKLSSKFFYDDKGSQIFQNIMNSEEYYLTDAEAESFELNKSDIASALPPSTTLIELGAGDGVKTSILIEELLKNKQVKEYIPIDISHEANIQITENFKGVFPDLNISPITSEYQAGMRWTRENCQGPKTVLFLGSNIGNFGLDDAKTFLRTLWSSLDHGDSVLIGFDLKKDFELLNKAYNDEHGHTENFNKNILERINRELGGDFNLDHFKHYGFYNPNKGCMESYLISTCHQLVTIESIEKNFEFQANEPIHLEYSYKYSTRDVENLALSTGFVNTSHYYDSKNFFMNSLWKVVKTKYA